MTNHLHIYQLGTNLPSSIVIHSLPKNEDTNPKDYMSCVEVLMGANWTFMMLSFNGGLHNSIKYGSY